MAFRVINWLSICVKINQCILTKNNNINNNKYLSRILGAHTLTHKRNRQASKMVYCVVIIIAVICYSISLMRVLMGNKKNSFEQFFLFLVHHNNDQWSPITWTDWIILIIIIIINISQISDFQWMNGWIHLQSYHQFLIDGVNDILTMNKEKKW